MRIKANTHSGRPVSSAPLCFLSIAVWIGFLFCSCLSSIGQDEDPKRTSEGPAKGQAKETNPKELDPRAEEIIQKMEAKIRKQQEDLELLKLFAMSLAEIEKSYVQKVDRRRLIEAAIDGMLHDLDKYSDFIPKNEMDVFETDIESEYGGIGIRVTQMPDEEFLTVTTPMLDSPSYRAGVKPDSWMIKIGDKDAKGITVDQAMQWIKGDIGTRIGITFRDKKSGKDVVLQIERAVIQVKTVLGDQRLPSNQWDYFLRRGTKPDEKIAYVRINNFGRQTATDLDEVMRDLKANGMQGLILDLRFNPGGLLSSAIDIADLFVEKGLIVRTEGRNTLSQKWVAKRAGTLTGFPIAVIINDRSASASEIVAACLQDAGRATVVGERSFGKGSVQNIVKLENGKSAMKLTTAAYFRPNGQNINRRPEHGDADVWGVRPDKGYEVNFDDEKQQAYFEYRRNQDVIRTEVTPAAEEFDDLQLAKALECIREAIEKNGSSDK